MTISLRLNDEDSKLFKKYAELNNVSMSELVRQSVIERIEDEYDLNAIAEYEKKKATGNMEFVSHEEVGKMLRLK